MTITQQNTAPRRPTPKEQNQMKRFSPLAGLTEKRLRLGALAEKDDVHVVQHSGVLELTESDEFRWSPARDLTRAPEIKDPEDKAEEGRASSEQQAPDNSPANSEEPANPAEQQPPAAAPAPAPAAASDEAPPKRRSSRVKTTLLGFDRSDGRTEDLFKEAKVTKTTEISKFPTGWLVVTEGPGRGTAIALHEGVSQIGRGDDQTVQLDFGDNSISRDNHAAVAYDEETRAFYLGHGGKTNIVRLNGTPVLSTEQLNNDDQIRIGETTLRFVAFCNGSFSWSDKRSGEDDV